MNALQIMIAVWTFLVVGFIALMIYRGHLTQHETDQLFLNEESGPSPFIRSMTRSFAASTLFSRFAKALVESPC